MAWEERLLPELKREIRNFSKMIISKYFFGRNNFVSEGTISSESLNT